MRTPPARTRDANKRPKHSAKPKNTRAQVQKTQNVTATPNLTTDVYRGEPRKVHKKMIHDTRSRAPRRTVTSGKRDSALGVRRWTKKSSQKKTQAEASQRHRPPSKKSKATKGKKRQKRRSQQEKKSFHGGGRRSSVFRKESGPYRNSPKKHPPKKKAKMAPYH